jgi:Domain of unknown function (DUF4864)
MNRYVKVVSCLLLLAGLRAASLATAGGDEPTDADWVSIRAVITSQLDAFKRDDADSAFSFASPGIQKQFRSAGEFMHMVRTGYRAVYRPGSVRFLEHFVLSGQAVQPLEIVTPDDSVVIAFYIMERQHDGAWKIAGCALGSTSALSI